MTTSEADAAWAAEALLRARAAVAPDEPALLAAHHALTWAELDAMVQVAARNLAAATPAAGATVALATGDPFDAIPVLLGAHRAGLTVALLPGGQTAAERDAALALIRPAVVIDRPAAWLAPTTDSAQQAATPGLAPQGLSPDAGPPDGAGPAVVVLTSGTTGRPKGVALSHRALAASADAWIAALPPATGWLLCVGLGHVAGLGVLWRAIRAGVPMRLAPSADPVPQLDALRASPPLSHVSLVPTQLARLLELTHGAVEAAPVALRAVPLGGGTISPSLVTHALAAGWPVVPTYGLSEIGSGATALPTAEAREHPHSAGRPLPGMGIAIEEPGPDGVGEIVVSTPAAFSGYLGEPPREPGAVIHTGDLGRLDPAGRLFVVDRRTDRIVRGGENIAPAEVEAALESHPAVAEAAVVARPDATWGHVPLAAVVLRPGVPAPADDELAAHARSLLAGFKVPAAFLRLDALPRTSSGKLRREAVRALVDGSPFGELARPGGDSVAWRVAGDPAAAVRDPLHLLLFPGTLSTAFQLDRLAGELARHGDLVVHALDRRGSGGGRLVHPGPTEVAVHVDDVRAYLDARGIASAVLAGHSFGGVVAIEAAARLPGRARAVVAFEPPYAPLADEATRARFARTAAVTVAAWERGGAPAAAEAFLRIVAGDDAWEQLSERGRGFLAREGDGAYRDSALLGMDPAGLARIGVPVTILTGGASLPFYRPIAEALVRAIPGASQATLPALTHNGPITDAAVVAAAFRDWLAGAGLLPAVEAHPESRP